MDKAKKIAGLITAFLIIIAILSWTECVTVTQYPAWSAWSPDLWNSPPVVSTARYWPVYICILTGIELILLWAVKKRFACWIGIFLNIAATVGPCIGEILLSFVTKKLGELIYDFSPGYNTYSFSFPVFLIIILGVVNTTLYCLLLRSRPTLQKSPEINIGY